MDPNVRKVISRLGGRERAKALTADRRREIAQTAAGIRWAKPGAAKHLSLKIRELWKSRTAGQRRRVGRKIAAGRARSRKKAA